MVVHIGHESITSWRVFVVRCRLVVPSFLSAWATNRWNEVRRRRQVAECTRSALRVEMQHNLKERRVAIAANGQGLDNGHPFRRRLVDALQAREVARHWRRHCRWPALPPPETASAASRRSRYSHTLKSIATRSNSRCRTCPRARAGVRPARCSADGKLAQRRR